jgi:hypothetical protein
VRHSFGPRVGLVMEPFVGSLFIAEQRSLVCIQPCFLVCV